MQVFHIYLQICRGNQIDQIVKLSYIPLYYMYMAKKVISVAAFDQMQECLITKTFWLKGLCLISMLCFTVQRGGSPVPGPEEQPEREVWRRKLRQESSKGQPLQQIKPRQLCLTEESLTPSEWTNRMTRNQSPSDPMSAPVFNTKRTADCTFQSKNKLQIQSVIFVLYSEIL